MPSVILHRHRVLGALAAAALCAAGAAGSRFVTSAWAAQSGTVTGSVTSLDAGQLTIQTPGRAVGVLNALTSAATRIEAEDLPYVWGGGHGEAGVASRGAKGGPGFNGRRIGYDCSGAVAAVLVAAGLWPAGQGVPNDWGVIRYLRRSGLIAPGAGTGPTEVTLYDDPGVHIFMNIDGRFWGTSDGAAGGDAKGGPGWLDDGAWDVTSNRFRRYHFVTAALKAKTAAGYSLTFDLAPQTESLPGLEPGMKVGISYSTSKYGTMLANAVSYRAPATTTTTTTTTTPTTPSAPVSTVAGAVTTIAPDDTSFTVQSAAGVPMTFEVTAGSTVAQQLAAGQIAVNAVVAVVYTSTPTPTSTAPGSTTVAPTGTTLTALSVTVNAPPPPPASGGGNIS